MSEQSGSINRCEGYRPHPGRLLFIAVPLAIGFMLGMRKGLVHQHIGHRQNWENGVPPFFAELHRRAHAAEDQQAGTVV